MDCGGTISVVSDGVVAVVVDGAVVGLVTVVVMADVGGVVAGVVDTGSLVVGVVVAGAVSVVAGLGLVRRQYPYRRRSAIRESGWDDTRRVRVASMAGAATPAWAGEAPLSDHVSDPELGWVPAKPSRSRPSTVMAARTGAVLRPGDLDDRKDVGMAVGTRRAPGR